MESIYEVTGDTLLIRLPAELDHHFAKKVKEDSDRIIRERGIKNIIFDFSDTLFMDSAGIGMIMMRYRILKERGGFVGIREAGSPIKRLMEISGLHKLVRVCE